MRRYYSSVFPQGERKARQQLKVTERLIMENPYIGKLSDDAREFPILRTPFSIIYYIRADVIEVVRIWDQRRNRDDLEI
jgi:plasmid stabilization system protein ParE